MDPLLKEESSSSCTFLFFRRLYLFKLSPPIEGNLLLLWHRRRSTFAAIQTCLIWTLSNICEIIVKLESASTHSTHSLISVWRCWLVYTWFVFLPDWLVARWQVTSILCNWSAWPTAKPPPLYIPPLQHQTPKRKTPNSVAERRMTLGSLVIRVKKLTESLDRTWSRLHALQCDA